MAGTMTLHGASAGYTDHLIELIPRSVLSLFVSHLFMRMRGPKRLR